MSANKQLTPPVNTDAMNRPINPHNTKMYWGDEQTLRSGVWAEPKLPKGFPLAIPRTIRFLYAYSKTDVPQEEDVQGCGCPNTGDCGDTLCTWTLRFKKVLYGACLAPEAIANGYTTVLFGSEPNPVFPLSTFSGGVSANYYPFDYVSGDTKINGGYVRVTRHPYIIVPEDIVYYGPALSAPDNLITKVYFYIVRWTYSCIRQSTGDPIINQCPQKFDVTYTVLNGPGAEGLECSQTVNPGTTNSNLDNDTGLVSFNFTTSEKSDYPEYGTACVPGPGPCG